MTVDWPIGSPFPQLPFRRLFAPIERKVPEGASIVTAYTDGQVTLRSNRSKVGYHEAADLSGFQGVHKGDFVVHGLDIMRGSVGVSDSDGALSPVCTVCRPIGPVLPEYAALVMRLQAMHEYPKALARGVREGGADFRRWQTLAELPVLVPPLDFQAGALRFLDRETARIDEMIDKQDRLIETLRERRSAVVECTVFAGLDSAAATSVNHFQWLPPQSPSHWTMTQLGNRTSTLAGYAFPSEGFSSDNCKTRLLRGINIKPGRLDWTETVYWDEGAYAISPAFKVFEGDLVLGLDRPFVSGGVRVASVSESDLPALLLQRVMLLRGGSAVEQRFLAYLLSTRAFLSYLEPLFTGVSVPHMSEWQVQKFRSPFPPFDEQCQIADHLDDAVAKIDSLIVAAQKFVTLAKERRSALITAAVTGQIDVRGAA